MREEIQGNSRDPVGGGVEGNINLLVVALSKQGTTVFDAFNVMEGWHRALESICKYLSSENIDGASALIQSGDLPKEFLAAPAVQQCFASLPNTLVIPANLTTTDEQLDQYRQSLREVVESEYRTGHAGRVNSIHAERLFEPAQLRQIQVELLNGCVNRGEFGVLEVLSSVKSVMSDSRLGPMKAQITDSPEAQARVGEICIYRSRFNPPESLPKFVSAELQMFGITNEQAGDPLRRIQVAEVARCRLDHLPRSLSRFGLSEGDFSADDFQAALIESIQHFAVTQVGSSSEMVALVQQLQPGNNRLVSRAFEGLIIDRIGNVGFDFVAGLKTNFSDEVRAALQSTAIMEKVRQVLPNIYPERYSKFVEAFELSPELIYEVCSPVVIGRIHDGFALQALELAERYGISEHLGRDPTYIDAMSQAIAREVAKGNSPDSYLLKASIESGKVGLSKEQIVHAWRSGLKVELEALAGEQRRSFGGSSSLQAQLCSPLGQEAGRDPEIHQLILDRVTNLLANLGSVVGSRQLPPLEELILRGRDERYRVKGLQGESGISVNDQREVDGLLRSVNIPIEVIHAHPSLQAQLTIELARAIRNRDVDQVAQIQLTRPLRPDLRNSPVIESATRDAYRIALTSLGVSQSKELMDKLGDFAPSKEIQRQAHVSFLASKFSSRGEVSQEEIAQLGISEREIKEAAAIAYVDSLGKGVGHIIFVPPRSDLLQRIAEPLDPALFPPAFGDLIRVFGLGDHASFQKFCSEDALALTLAKSPSLTSAPSEQVAFYLGDSLELSPELVTIADSVPLSYLDAESMLRGGVDLKAVVAAGNYERMFQELKRFSPRWKNQGALLESFERGAAEFGHRAMLRYVASQEMHDALSGFDVAVPLSRSYGSETNKFIVQILDQVARDGSVVVDQRAGARFSEIARTVVNGMAGGDLANYVQKVADVLSGYPSLSGLQETAQYFSQVPSRIFESWQSLQKFHDLVQAGSRGDLLKRLESMSSSGDSKLQRRAQWFEAVAFDPESRIALQDVITLMEAPEVFLARDEDASIQALHEPKKPIHMTKVPCLDLTAEQLVYYMQDGVLDSLQNLPAFEMNYRVPAHGKGLESSREALRAAISSETQKQKERFNLAKKFLAHEGVDIKAFLNGSVELQSEADMKLLDFIYSDAMGFDGEMLEVRVKIARKSDPSAHVAGNRTKSCMAFGVGKQIVYSFHLGCAHLIMEIERGGVVSTVAQSVLTEDRDLKRSINDLHKIAAAAIAKTKEGSFSLDALLPEAILNDNTSFIAADNREVAKNRQTAAYSSIVNAVYADFLSEYVRRLPESWDINREWVPVGKAYSYGMEGVFDEVPNTSAPVAPIGYSDKTGENVYRVDLKRPAVAGYKKVVSFDGESVALAEHWAREDVAPMTIRDAIPAAMIQERAYADQWSLVSPIHQIQAVIMGSRIKNCAENRPNLSFRLRKEGQFQGYILAYEGKSPLGVGAEPVPVVYVQDFVSVANAEGLLGRGQAEILTKFASEYVRHYLEGEKAYPIFAHFRDKTTYKFLRRMLNSAAQEYAVDFKVEEFPAESWNGSTMYPIALTPRLSPRAEQVPNFS